MSRPYRIYELLPSTLFVKYEHGHDNTLKTIAQLMYHRNNVVVEFEEAPGTLWVGVPGLPEISFCGPGLAASPPDLATKQIHLEGLQPSKPLAWRVTT
jgi:hypothetical protein